VIFAVLRRMALKELEASVPGVSRYLLQRAVQRLPAEHREDIEEEWRAGLGDAIDKRPLWALMEVTSLYMGAGRIAAELEPTAAPARAGGAEGRVVGRVNGFIRGARAPLRGARSFWSRLGPLAARALAVKAQADPVRTTLVFLTVLGFVMGLVGFVVWVLEYFLGL
jgi:hypothetical protein